MTWQEEVKQLIDIVLPTGKSDIAHIQKIFNIYNEHRHELIKGVNLNKETGTHCSGCVNRVITRLQTYLNAQRS
jgi:hypothetical protein